VLAEAKKRKKLYQSKDITPAASATAAVLPKQEGEVVVAAAPPTLP